MGENYKVHILSHNLIARILHRNERKAHARFLQDSFFMLFICYYVHLHQQKKAKMKKSVTILQFLFVSLMIRAQTELTIYNNSAHPETHNSGFPIVSSAGDDVIIKCDSNLTNVNIIIKDYIGNIIHSSTQNISPLETKMLKKC